MKNNQVQDNKELNTISRLTEKNLDKYQLIGLILKSKLWYILRKLLDGTWEILINAGKVEEAKATVTTLVEGEALLMSQSRSSTNGNWRHNNTNGSRSRDSAYGSQGRSTCESQGSSSFGSCGLILFK